MSRFAARSQPRFSILLLGFLLGVAGPAATWAAVDAGSAVGRGNVLDSSPGPRAAAETLPAPYELADTAAASTTPASGAPGATTATSGPWGAWSTRSAPAAGRFAVASVFVVTTAADTGSQSLRAAITSANADPTLDLISFAIPGAGVQTIQLTAPLPTIVQPVIIDGTTQAGYAGTPLIELDGTLAGANANGLTINAGGCTIRGLIINRFKTAGSAGYGIRLDVAGFNVIEGCYIGTNAAGTAAAPNAVNGIAVFGASGGNLIGGTTAAARNVLSGNSSSGIQFGTGNIGGNIVRGNWIGLDATGANVLANGGNGIFLNSTNNLIGGTTPGSRNVISGNALPGIFVGLAATSTTIQGNWIGTDATGALDRGNVQNGINIDRANNTIIGGATIDARNVIGGNDLPNIYVLGPATGTKIQGNYIGTDATGTVALGDGNAVVIDNAANNQVGGGSPGEGNLISGHPFSAVVIQNAGATGNTVRGNLIGTNAEGTAALPNTRGILVLNAARNVIGGTTVGERNVVSGNDIYGIELRGAANCRVSGNYVGTDVTGLLDVGNRQHGIVVIASTDTLGGPTAAHGNVVAFNRGVGIYDSTGTANLIRFNKTFENHALGIDLFPRGISINDSLDSDGGVNGLQNFPLLDSAVVAGGSTRIHGRLNSKPVTSYVIDFYRSDAFDPSHFGEGRTPLGWAAAVTDPAGRATFTFTVPESLPATQYVTATATDGSGSTSEFSQSLCMNDADGDGVMDCWETQGWGIDANSDTQIDLDLYARGARPDHKDLFVEIDAMSGYAPPPGVLGKVFNSFAAVPNAYLNNPDGQDGIYLHYELDDTTIAVQNLPNIWTSFKPVKDEWFGTQAERTGPNAANILQAKRLVYRYGLWARTMGAGSDTLWSGIAELWGGQGGDDFMVTLGSTCDKGCWNATKDVDIHAGTFMHEMGHTLGLWHGGADDVQYKPNYYSVMNYTWQVPRWYHLPGSWHCDYSPAALPSLDESNLNEWNGLDPPQNVFPIVSVPFTDPLGKIQYARLDWGIPADWNNDSLLTNPVAVDLNLVGEPTGVTNPGQPLVSHADWPNLQYNFRKSSAFSPSGVLRVQSVSQESPPEMTREIYDRLNAMPAPKPVGQFLMDGQLDPTASLRASHGGASLYASYRSGQLYLATETAQSSGADVFLLVANSPGGLLPAPLGKSGQVGAWAALLANESADNSTVWWHPTGVPLVAFCADTAGALLEGVLDVELLNGRRNEQLYVAVARYATADGGGLLTQVPAGNGDINLDGNEFLQLVTTVAVTPRSLPGGGRLQLFAARPNPALDRTAARFTLPAAGDVLATVHDVAGRTVARLAQGRFAAGEHELTWHPGDAGRRPAAGVYFIVLRALGETRTTRVVVLD